MIIRAYEVPEMFAGVNYGLNWITNDAMRHNMEVRYKLYALAVPSTALTAEQMQLTADAIRERYNKMYENLHLPFNPLYNVDATEETTTTVTGADKNGGKSSQYPMNSTKPRDVISNEQNGEHNEQTVVNHRRYGNIGVTKSTELLKSANDLLRDLIFDYMAEFGDWFMLTTKGEY